MDFHGFSWISMDFHGIPWISWIFMDFHGFPWISWDSMDFMDFHRFHGFHGFRPGPMSVLPHVCDPFLRFSFFRYRIFFVTAFFQKKELQNGLLSRASSTPRFFVTGFFFVTGLFWWPFAKGLFCNGFWTNFHFSGPHFCRYPAQFLKNGAPKWSTVTHEIDPRARWSVRRFFRDRIFFDLARDRCPFLKIKKS